MNTICMVKNKNIKSKMHSLSKKQELCRKKTKCYLMYCDSGKDLIIQNKFKKEKRKFEMFKESIFTFIHTIQFNNNVVEPYQFLEFVCTLS